MKKGYSTPTRLKAKRKHGFLKRRSTASGRKILNRRRKKGRWQLIAV